jgi:hypothetical protein
VPLPCSICIHGERAAIDRALIRGVPIPELTARYRVSPDALLRHKHRHLPLRLVKAQAAQEVTDADQLLTEVKGLRAKAFALLFAAERAGDLRTALTGVREARGCLELLAKLQGVLDERPQVTVVNVLTSTEWLDTRRALMQALEPYVEARAAVAARLKALGAS